MDNERIVSTILILGLALVSIRHLPSKPGSVSAKETGVASPSSENKSSVSKAPSSSSASGSNHLAPLRDFLQTQCSQSMEGGERIYDELAKQANIRALVATVPDPIDSSLTYLFDQMVDSIQRAAEGEGYVLDRFYFPWQESVSEKASDSTISKLLPLEPKEQGKPENGHSGKPGLLLFRNPQQIPNGESKVPLLAVFLVGETPTFGIDKIAFACALNEAVKLEKGKEVKILSPCFSGSQTSLALALRQWVESSGSASLEKITMIGGGSAVSKSGLESCLKNSHPHKENRPPPEISFRSMVISSPLLKRALLAYLWRQNSQYSPNARSDKMVILAESNTSFGSNAGFGKARAEKNQTEDGKDSRIIKEGNWLVTYIPFPLHISEARSAYQRESSQRSEEILYRDAPGSKLRIPTESNKKARDTQPSFAPQMAAAINELSLSALLAAVSRDGYRYVGIIATDERDSIFLGRLVREQCPDVQLFTIQPTLAYTHLEYSTFLRGMLVANSYPLCAGSPARRLSDQKSAQLQVFPNALSEAYYNGVIALLANDPEYMPPGLLDFGHPTYVADLEDEIAPVIWISVVGERGFHPLQAYDLRGIELKSLLKEARLGLPSPEEHEYTYHKRARESVEPPYAPRYSFLWIIVVATGGIGCLWVSKACLFAVRHGQTQDPSRGASLRELFDEREKEAVSFQRFWIRLLFFSLLIGFVPLAWPYLALHDSWELWKQPLEPGKFLLLFGVMPVFLLLVMVTLLAALLRACGVERVSHLVTGRFFKVLVGAILALAVLWVITVRWSLAERIASVDPLYVERAINFSDGVSPLVPTVLLAAAISCWCFSQLSRLHLLEEFSVKNPFPDKEAVFPWNEIQKRDEQVRDILQYPYRKGMRPSAYLGWALAVTVILGFWLFYKGVPTLESGRLFGFFARSGFIILTCLLICAWLQLIDLWKKLQQLLGELAKLPLADGFTRLPEKASSFFGRYLDSKRDRSEQIDLARRQLDALLAEYTSSQTILKKANLRLEPKTLDDWEAASRENTLDRIDAGLCHVCQECAQKLWTVVWRNTAVDEGFADPVSTPADKGAASTIQKRAARLKILAPVLSSEEAEKTAQWVGRAEEFVAIQIVRYVSQFFVHLKRLIVFLVVTVLLLLLGVSSYPFQPQRLAIGLLAVAIAAILGAALFLFVQIDRNEIVSRISKTPPHRFTLNWAFVSNFMTYAVPLLGVLAAQLAGGSDLVRSWMEPILRLLR